jgi:hypothetical protein
MKGRGHLWVLTAVIAMCVPARMPAQGTIEDYRCAASFQTGAHRKLITVANVTPHWIGKTSRFWYSRSIAKKTEFVVVDAEQNTSVPAFDHERLAAGLERATKQDFKTDKLPFEVFRLRRGLQSHQIPFSRC